MVENNDIIYIEMRKVREITKHKTKGNVYI